MRYSDEFKNHVVSRLLTGEVTISQAQEQYGVSTFSLREWRKKALSKTFAVLRTIELAHQS